MKPRSRPASVLIGFVLMGSMAWAFKYTQDILVDQPGLTRFYIPAETTEKYRVREEIRLFDPDGRETPYLFEYWNQSGLPKQIVMDPLSIQNQVLEDKSILTFRPSPGRVDSVVLTSGEWKRFKPATLEMSTGGNTWSTLCPLVSVGMRGTFVLPFPNSGAKYRFTLNDEASPPLSNPRLSYTPHVDKPEVEKVSVPFRLTGSSRWGERYELTAPRRNMSVDGVGLYVEDISRVDFSHIRTTMEQISDRKEISPVTESQTSIVDVVCPGSGAPPYLSVRAGLGHDNYALIVYLPSVDGSAVRVTKAVADILPVSMFFDARKPGAYQMRFGIDGPATDLVLVYGDEIRALRGRTAEKGIRLARPSKVNIHKVFSESFASNAWDPLPDVFNESHYRQKMLIRVEREGIQSADVPAEVFNDSSPDGADWRLTKGNQELPFLIRLNNGTSQIETSFTPVPAGPGKTRWEIAGSYKNVPWIALRFDVKGPFPPAKARLIDKGLIMETVLLESTWEFDESGYKKFLSTTNYPEIPPKRKDWPTVLYIGSNGRSVTGDRLILEVDASPFDLSMPKVSGGTHKIIFKAKPEDNIQFLFGGDAATPPSYALRKDVKIPIEVAQQTAYFVKTSKKLTSDLDGKGTQDVSASAHSVSSTEEISPKTEKTSKKAPVAVVYLMGAVLVALLAFIVFSGKKKS